MKRVEIFNDNYSYRSSGYYKNYNTNITEKVLINDFEFKSDSKYLNNGIINNKKFFYKTNPPAAFNKYLNKKKLNILNF